MIDTTQLRKDYEEVYGDYGVYVLYGKLVANVSDEVLERFQKEINEKKGDN